MPELPEVETTIRGLNILINKKVIKIITNTKKLRYNIPSNISYKFKDQKIISTERIAKYILINFFNNLTLIIHLGMSGRLKVTKSSYVENKHDHVIILFGNGYKLIFNDPRKFGFIDIAATLELNQKKYISSLGVDALSIKFNTKYMYTKIKNSAVPIKQILLNQYIVSGIGNIYACEILYDAKISPLIQGKDLNINQIRLIIKSAKKILKKAISYGGSSIKDYRSSDGTLGNFQSNFKVYGKEGQKVSKFEIIKIVQYGRATFYCPGLQKEQNSN